jgi:hypothetical protein
MVHSHYDREQYAYHPGGLCVEQAENVSYPIVLFVLLYNK